MASPYLTSQFKNSVEHKSVGVKWFLLPNETVSIRSVAMI